MSKSGGRPIPLERLAPRAAESIAAARAVVEGVRDRAFRLCPRPDSDPNSLQSRAARACESNAQAANQPVVYEVVEKLPLRAPAGYYSQSAARVLQVKPYKDRAARGCIRVGKKNTPWRIVNGRKVFDQRCGNSFGANPCVTKGVKSGPHSSCLLNLVYIDGEPHLRACTDAKEGGRIFRVKDFDHAARIGRALCDRSQTGSDGRVVYEEPEPSVGFGRARKRSGKRRKT